MAPTKPLQERVDEIRTKITLETHTKFKHIKRMRERNQEMINYLGEQLSLALAELEIYKKNG